MVINEILPQENICTGEVFRDLKIWLEAAPETTRCEEPSPFETAGEGMHFLHLSGQYADGRPPRKSQLMQSLEKLRSKSNFSRPMSFGVTKIHTKKPQRFLVRA